MRHFCDRCQRMVLANATIDYEKRSATYFCDECGDVVAVLPIETRRKREERP